ncbi:hypothetical protein OHC33_000088 [Knufia fluminis]|uniref:CAP-Gly domain-containing protein n=1 Tax=Knufia fluminis TaxID=191047 RepID=A0AAN8F1G0_9EURO|nr:hypothetical protein OHC33_000088 [Knufia fluminis]
MATSRLRVGQTVKATTDKETHQGILRYVGAIKDGPPGTFCGIELPDATGKNDGSVRGQRYFKCAPGHGLFVKETIVTPVAATKPAAKRASVVPSTASSSRASTINPVSKRASTASISRPSNVRQSISSLPPKKTPSSRPSSQIVPREVAPLRPKRASIQSVPRTTSPEKPIEEEPVDEHEEDVEEQEVADGEDKDNDEAEVDLMAAEPPMPPPSERPRRPTASRDSIKEQASVAAQTSREVESLKVKLRAMEKKRIEDRDKIKQVETFQSENERLSNIVKTLQTKLRTTTEERKDAQSRVQEMEQQLQSIESEKPAAQLESELELATIDKEMAEEKADALQHELDMLKAKFEELELETDILREENKELTSTMTEEERAGAGWIHLERERDRLRDALLLLRDNKQEVETELREEIEHLRDNLNATEEEAAKYLEAAEQLHRVEDTNAHLKEQLEAAENQEEVISNMMLERDRHLSQIENLRGTLSELEELAQTNEDLEQLYLDNEKGLLSRLDEQEAVIQERERKTTEQDRAIEDLEYTLNKFRSVVQGLQSDIDEARRTREISELQAHEMGSRSKAMMELNLRLQNNAAKSQTKAIEIEMVRAQAALRERHVEMLSLFLPESFDSERTPIAALLSFSMLKTKARIVANMLAERLRDRGHLSSGEETLTGYQVVEAMQRIYQTAGRFEQFMSACSPAEFSAFSNAGQEIEPVERAVTNWLEALKTDEFGPDSPDHLKRMQSILADMTEKLLSSGAETNATYLLAETQLTMSHTEVAASLLDWVAKAVKTKIGEPEDDDSDSLDFDRKVDQLSTRARTIKLACSKVAAELEKKRSKNICLDETTWPLFTSTEQHASTINEQIHQLCRVLISFLNEVDQDEELSYANLFETLTEEDDVFSDLLNDMKTLQDQVESLSTKALEQSSNLTFEPQPAPWTIRAKEIKAQRQMSSEVQEELTQASRRNHELSARISDKERAIEEMTIRAELAEKRVKDNKSKETQDKALKDDLDRLKLEKNELETQLSVLRTDLLGIQEENRKDKDQIAALQAAAPEEAPNGTHVPSTPGMIDPAANAAMSAHIKALLAEIEALQATVRHLRWENRELSIPLSATKFRAASDAWLDPANLKTSKTKSRANKASRLQVEQNDQLDVLLDVSKSMNMRPVRLKDTWQKDDTWRSVKESTRWQVLRQKEEVESWEAVRDRAEGGFVVRVR